MNGMIITLDIDFIQEKQEDAKARQFQKYWSNAILIERKLGATTIQYSSSHQIMMVDGKKHVVA